LLSIACIIALIASGRASAGELVYKGCVSADGTPRLSGAKSCAAIGEGSFDALNSLALAPDGRSLYAGNGIACRGLDYERCYASAAVDRFRRDPVTGALDYRSCLTGATEQRRTCAEIPSATRHAFAAGLGDVASMAVSPDGSSLYVASSGVTCIPNDYGGEECFGSNALARFDRDPETGAITYVDCITGDRRSGPSGSGACTEIPSATADGRDSGLSGLGSVALSDDGRSLYAAAPFDNSIARFDRDPATGALTYRGCITGDKQLGPSGSGACTEIPGATQSGSGLADVRSIVLSDDGTSLYGVASLSGGDVARFDRDPATGDLTYRGCITGDVRLGPSGSGACTEIPSATAREGEGSGLGRPVSLVLSADGRSLYVGASFSDSIARFDRDPTTGAIAFVGCVTGNTEAGPSGSGACRQIRGATEHGFALPVFSMALGAGGRSLYGGFGSTVARLRVKPATGALRYDGCLTGDKDIDYCKKISTATPYRGSGLHGISDLAAKDKTLYAAAESDDDIATLAIAPQTKIKKARIRRHRAAFRFRAGTRSKFTCKLKGKHVPRRLRHWRRCGSHGFRHKGKQVYRGLRRGRKVFRVRATDRAHTTDPSPAKRRWGVR